MRTRKSLFVCHNRFVITVSQVSPLVESRGLMDISEVVSGYLAGKLGQAPWEEGDNDHEGQAVIYHGEGRVATRRSTGQMSVMACYQEDPWLEATSQQEIDGEQFSICKRTDSVFHIISYFMPKQYCPYIFHRKPTPVLIYILSNSLNSLKFIISLFTASFLRFL